LPPFRAMGWDWVKARVEKVKIKSKDKSNGSGRGRPLHMGLVAEGCIYSPSL
jgi:hypothetical protein